MTDPLIFECVVGEPPETVFDAFTSDGGQRAFYGNDAPGWVVRNEADVRVDGAWTIDFGPSPDEIYRHHHVFEAIERPQRLLLATSETRLNGTILKFETEFRFEAHDGGTLMTMIQRGLPTDELRAEHGLGVANAFDLLERFIDPRR